MGNKDPAFLFYSSDFLTGTMLMSDEQVGRYIRLMCLQHQTGHLSENDMLKVCVEKDEKIFSKFVVDRQGFYYNKRLEDEILKRKEYSKSRKENGSKGGRPKKPYANHMDSILKAYDNHIEDENDNENASDIELKKASKKDIDSFYESIWLLYPVKKGKTGVSETQKKKLYAIGYDELKRAIERYDSEVKDKQYMKHGSTFFNGGYVDYLDANYQEPEKKDEPDRYDNPMFRAIGRGSVFENLDLERFK